jgi:hypothetical protein
MVMREAQPVQRMPQAKLLGASKDWWVEITSG